MKSLLPAEYVLITRLVLEYYAYYLEGEGVGTFKVIKLENRPQVKVCLANNEMYAY